MRPWFFLFSFLFLIQLIRTVQAEDVILENNRLRVIVNDRPAGGGFIRQILDVRTTPPVPIFDERDAIGEIVSGDYAVEQFRMQHLDNRHLIFLAGNLSSPAGLLPVQTRVTLDLDQERLYVAIDVTTRSPVELASGLDVIFNSINWNRLFIYNQSEGEDDLVLGRRNLTQQKSLNQIYEWRNDRTKLFFIFPNPYHSFCTLTESVDRRLVFDWRLLIGAKLRGQQDLPPIASVLVPGVTLHREMTIVALRSPESLGEVVGPFAYFSPFPDGYEQVIAITLDDLPLTRWYVPRNGHDDLSRPETYMVRLLERHPQMKIGWVMLMDGITDAREIVSPDYPRGKWWLAHGDHRMSEKAPEEYRSYLHDIENGRNVRGYEDRIQLGIHGYHHSREMEFPRSWEFESFDPVYCDSAFAAIRRDVLAMGLSQKSMQWVRFPAFRFTRSAIDAIIRNHYRFFDHTSPQLPAWLVVYSAAGRIWGAAPLWEADTPQDARRLRELLKAGKLAYVAGHPTTMFGGDREASFQRMDDIFTRVEAEFPNLGYLFPDQVGTFADETCDLASIKSRIRADALEITFTGQVRQGQTLVVEWPHWLEPPSRILVDGLPLSGSVFRRDKYFITLPQSGMGIHTVQLGFGLERQVSNYYTEFYQPFPNPFDGETGIACKLPASESASLVTVTITDVCGQLVRRLYEGACNSGYQKFIWNGRDDSGRPLPAGVYFYTLKVGTERHHGKLIRLR
jgi:hypothetical protein